MYEVILFMGLIKEVYFIFDIQIPNPEAFCKVFEDNGICISIAESNKFSPGTKYIAIKSHHFQTFVQNNTIFDMIY